MSKNEIELSQPYMIVRFIEQPVSIYQKYFDPDLYNKIILMLSIINIPAIQHYIRENELTASDL